MDEPNSVTPWLMKKSAVRLFQLGKVDSIKTSVFCLYPQGTRETKVGGLVEGCQFFKRGNLLANLQRVCS